MSEKTSLLGTEHSDQQKVVIVALVTCLVTIVVCGIAAVIYVEATIVPPKSRSEIECNGNGVYYSDTGCSCQNCYTGSGCSILVQNCVIEAESGNPFLQEGFWQIEDATTLQAIETPYDYRVPYQSSLSGSFNQSYNTSFGGAINMAIRNLHKKFNNLVVDDYYIVLTSGGTQGIVASIFSLCAAYNQSFTLFAQIPYYNAYNHPCQILYPQCCTFSTNMALPPSTNIVELVTHPNNPDGTPRERLYQNYTNSTWIQDIVYYWPHLTTANITPREAPISIVSLTKFAGFAGTRFGWLVIKDSAVAQAAANYVRMQNLHVSAEGAQRALKVLNLFTSSEGDKLVSYVKSKLSFRWQILEQIFSNSSLNLPFVPVGIPYTWYLYLQCTEMTDGKNCQQMLLDYGISGRDGSQFGNPGYVRLSLAMRDYAFDQMILYLQKNITSLS